MTIKKKSTLDTMQVLLVSLFAVALCYGIWPKKLISEDYDAHAYLNMAYGKSSIAPFVYRVLGPKIVNVMPFPPELGFIILTYSSTLGILLLSYRLLRELGIPHISSMLTVFFMAFSYPIVFYLSRWGRIDPLSNLFFVFGLLLIYKRRTLFASVTIAIGVFAKETLIILLPLLLLTIMKQKGENRFNKLLYAIALCLTPLACLLMLQKFITPVDSDFFSIHGIDDLKRLLHFVWSGNVEDIGFFVRAIRELLRAYGFFWVPAFFGLLIQREMRAYCLYLIGVGFALCTIATDWSRMLGMIFPGVFIPVGVFVEKVRQTRASKHVLSFLVPLAVLQSYLSLLEYRPLSQMWKTGLIVGILSVFVAGTIVSVWGYRSILSEREYSMDMQE